MGSHTRLFNFHRAAILQCPDRFVLVEGTMISCLSDLLNAVFVLMADPDVCRSRREGRDYGSKDPPEYFDRVILPA